MSAFSDRRRAAATSFRASQNTPSSDSEVLCPAIFTERLRTASPAAAAPSDAGRAGPLIARGSCLGARPQHVVRPHPLVELRFGEQAERDGDILQGGVVARSEEHTSELQSLMRIWYADFSLKKN